MKPQKGSTGNAYVNAYSYIKVTNQNLEDTEIRNFYDCFCSKNRNINFFFNPSRCTDLLMVYFQTYTQ